MPTEPTPSALAPELLLGQADFVRALSRSLLADPGAADDVAQDALAMGLERPPAEAGALRAWLARVVRNLALQRGRGEARRAAREERVARPERVPSTAEVLERETARASVVRAVLVLEEPYRSTILLRFYESRPPRDIARMLSLPVETVHTRTKRALALLRERLDREFGQRSAWAALLLPFARPPVVTVGVDASPSFPNQRKPVMNLSLKLAGLGLVLATGAAFWLRTGPSRGGPISAQVRLASEASARVDAASPRAADGLVPRRAEVPSVPVSASKVAAADPAPVLALSSTSLRLGVTWSDGTPASGVTARATDVGRASYDALEATTDAAGTCSFTGLRAGKVAVQLDRKARRDSAVLVAGEETALALQIPRGFDVEGLVHDANGAPVAGASVWLGRSEELPFLVTTSATDGSFSVRSLQKRVSLWARRDGQAPSLARSFDHPEGAVAEETIALRGAGATVAGRVLDAEGQPIEGARVLVDGQQVGRVELTDVPEGTVMAMFAIDSTSGAHSGPVWVRTDADGRFIVGGVRPGTVPLGVLAPGHAPWRGSLAAAAGASASTDITLSRGWSLSGQVLDAQGNPSAGCLMVHLATVPGLLCPFVEIDSDGSFELQDLAQGALSVWIHGAAGDARTTLTGQAGDALEWDAYLGPEVGQGPLIDSWDE